MWFTADAAECAAVEVLLLAMLGAGMAQSVCRVYLSIASDPRRTTTWVAEPDAWRHAVWAGREGEVDTVVCGWWTVHVPVEGMVAVELAGWYGVDGVGPSGDGWGR